VGQPVAYGISYTADGSEPMAMLGEFVTPAQANPGKDTTSRAPLPGRQGGSCKACGLKFPEAYLSL